MYHYGNKMDIRMSCVNLLWSMALGSQSAHCVDDILIRHHIFLLQCQRAVLFGATLAAIMTHACMSRAMFTRYFYVQRKFDLHSYKFEGADFVGLFLQTCMTPCVSMKVAYAHTAFFVCKFDFLPAGIELSSAKWVDCKENSHINTHNFAICDRG